jgi:hypothetical protein
MPNLCGQTAYHWYLGSAFWREKSQYILRRANYICEKRHPASD